MFISVFTSFFCVDSALITYSGWVASATRFWLGMVVGATGFRAGTVFGATCLTFMVYS